MKGLILGDKREIAPDMQAAFVNAGIAHVLAVSGLNVACLALIVTSLLSRFHLKYRAMGAAAAILAFWFLAGNSPPVARAVYMGLLVILNNLLNRKVAALHVLSLAAFIVLILEPSDLFTASFQLSFVGVLSLLLVYPFFTGLVNGIRIEASWLRTFLLYILVTVAAQIGLLPITNFYFGKVSLTAIGANVFVVFLTSLVMAGSFLVLLIGMAWNSLGIMLGAGVDALIHLVYGVAAAAGGGPSSFISVYPFTLAAAAAYYSLLLMIGCVLVRMQNPAAKMICAAEGLVLLLMVHVVCVRPLFPRGELSCLAIDVGQGDATLCVFPAGTTMLIDAGNASAAYDYGKAVVLPVLDRMGIRKLDALVITHPDADHCRGAAAIIAAGRAAAIYKLPLQAGSRLDSLIERYTGSRGVPVFYPHDTLWQVDGGRVYFLPRLHAAAAGGNDNSICMMIQYGAAKLLLTGDAQRRREEELVLFCGSFLRAGVLKVAHHGSKNGTTTGLLDAVRPSLAVISVGKNRYGHPDPAVLGRLRERGATVLRTDGEGAVLLRSAGGPFCQVSWK